jgi:hypothetical protein
MLRRPLTRLAGGLAAALGLQLVSRSYYSPVPELASLDGEVWERRSPLRGIELSTTAQIEFAERELAEFLEEARFPRTGRWDEGRFFLDNRSYESVDAEVLYAMVRRSQPARIVELGSGWSTLVMAEACEANRRRGIDTQLVSYEPFPRGNVPEGTPGLSALRRVRAQDVPLEVFEELAAGDILFVDTTHTVKLASDVNFIVLEVLPLLRPGVLVHFHDIWLPYEYHRVLVEQMGMYWAEQYLLQAFLSGNRSFEIVWAAQAVVREHRERVRRLVPSMSDDQWPSAFWLRRTGP